MNYNDDYRPFRYLRLPTPSIFNHAPSGVFVLPSKSQLCNVCEDLNVSIHEFVLESRDGYIFTE